MRYVIVRDDDTNALTPIACLERLYRPFLDKRLPVNLAVIPDVATGTVQQNGEPEGYLFAKNGHRQTTLPISSNPDLVDYLRGNGWYHVVQHGCHHDYFEFNRKSPAEIGERLARGMDILLDAGFAKPNTFVAPYDKISRPALRQIARRFRVLSTGWFELQRIPWNWWPDYLVSKWRGEPHWEIRNVLLLSHPGCLLSCRRPRDSMFQNVVRSIHTRTLTVLVTHWWEYFRGGKPDDGFIAVLHETADYLASNPDIQVISFDALATGKVRVPRLGGGPS